jgi:hypothetical protein
VKRHCLVVALSLSACSLHGTRRPRIADDGTLDCTDDIGVPIFDTVVGAAALALGTYVFVDFNEDTDTRDNAYSVATPFIATGALAVGSAIYGYMMVSRCDKAHVAAREQKAQARVRRKEKKRAQRVAWQVTQRAMAAARSGDCDTVAKLDPEVRTIEEDFYVTVFRQDAAIARCLGASATPLPAPPTTTPPTNAPPIDLKLPDEPSPPMEKRPPGTP